MGRTQRINEIDNDSMKSIKNRLIDINDINDRSRRGKRRVAPKVEYTDYVADKLVDIFEAPKSRNFFLKCAWNLSEDTIWSAVEETRKKCVTNPIGLFIFLCNNELQKLPIKKR